MAHSYVMTTHRLIFEIWQNETSLNRIFCIDAKVKRDVRKNPNAIQNMQRLVETFNLAFHYESYKIKND